MLRQRRAGVTQFAGESDGAEQGNGIKASQSTMKYEPPGLSADSSFWELKEPMDEFRVEISYPEVEVAVLRRLGKPSFWRSRKQFSRLLSLTYNTVSDSIHSLTTWSESWCFNTYWVRWKHFISSTLNLPDASRNIASFGGKFAKSLCFLGINQVNLRFDNRGSIEWEFIFSWHMRYYVV